MLITYDFLLIGYPILNVRLGKQLKNINMILTSVSFDTPKELEEFVNGKSIPPQNIVSIVSARKSLPGGLNCFAFVEWALFYYE